MSQYGQKIHPLADGEALSASERIRIFTYFAGLLAILSISDPSGGLIDIPVSFILKNRMHMEATDIAVFRLVASIPLYLSFLFGLLRDKMNEERDRDCQLMVLFSLCNVVAYTSLSLVPVSYATLLIGNLIPTSFFLIVLSAQSGMTASFAQRYSMTGPASATWNFMSYLSSAAAFVIGGYVSQMLETRSLGDSTQTVYLMGAAASFATFILACARPKLACANAAIGGPAEKPALKDLLGYAPVYPALGVWLLWNFAPGAATPLQYYLQNSLGASDSQWGIWNAVFTTSFLPAFVMYGVLSFYISFRRLLFFSAVVAIPQFVPLLFVETLDQAMLFAVAAGLSGGMATAAYLDLLIRSCPVGFHGTTIMASGAVYFLAIRLGDVLGSYLYGGPGGFRTCVFVMTATYASIIVVLRFVPSKIFGDNETTISTSASELR